MNQYVFMCLNNLCFPPGMMRGNCKVLAQAKLALSENSVTIQLTVRSMDERVAELVVSTLD